MKQYNIYDRYEIGVIPPEKIQENSIWFIFKKGKLLIKQINNDIRIPAYKDICGLLDASLSYYYIGKLEEKECYSVEVSDEWTLDGYGFYDLRPIIGNMDYTVCALAGKARQIIYWDETHKFCGKCGAPTEDLYGERAKFCPKCSFISYPRISPAIIVAIIKDDRILLAHNNKFKNNVYSTIAGYVEPGETFEECVMREVKEEVGINIKNIRYFGSQPWPFPNSLMIAFTAEYDSGKIVPDGVEIGDAAWFHRDNMPEVPMKGSVARRLVDWYLGNK